MNKFDVVEKIQLRDLIAALRKEETSPEEALRQAGIIRGQWQASYFNWGRNALYGLFKQLPYKTIHFPAFTCPVLTDAAEAAGKKVELLEVDPETFNLDFGKLPKKPPECLVAVHTFGNPVDMKELRRKYPKAFIVEDCAHALFSKIRGEYVGNSGDAVLFSLYKQVPNLNGALLLTKEPLALQQKQEVFSAFWPRIVFKTHGWHHLLINLLRQRYINTLEERRFTDSVAPHPAVERLFVHCVPRLRGDIPYRRQVAVWYQAALKDHPFLVPQKENPQGESSWYQMVVQLKPEVAHLRDQIVRRLRQQNIFLDRLWYSAPITDKKYAHFKKSCPQAHRLAQSVISLPTRPGLTRRDVNKLVGRITQQISNES
jgi:dTDP-4-amino-4,6-dideoxygalactose transaminase